MDSGLEWQRYSRQLLIEGFGPEAQVKLHEAKVAIAGVGGLGGLVAIYLAVAGVGTLKLIDHDRVELSNLNRQILYTEEDIGKKKCDVAGERIAILNKEISVEATGETITDSNVLRLVGNCDLIVDAMDNFPTRFLLNRAAVQKGLPFFHGAVSGFEGRATTILPGKTACLQCLYPRSPEPAISPVIGVAPAVIGSIQATEVIKYIAGIGELLTNRMLVYDGLALEFMEIRLQARPDCRVCNHLWGRIR